MLVGVVHLQQQLPHSQTAVAGISLYAAGNVSRLPARQLVTSTRAQRHHANITITAS